MITNNSNVYHNHVIVFCLNKVYSKEFLLFPAYLRKSDVNVIVMDWRRLALSDYATAVRGVPAVGRGLGQFMNFLNQVTGHPFTSMHLVGFSLGAHIVGNAGREMRGRAARVTGTVNSPNSNKLYKSG